MPESAAVPPGPDATGPVNLGKYQLLKLLAVGGMAEIYLARVRGIEGFEKHVVVKQIVQHYARDPHFVQMFLDEARLAAQLHHQNIGQVYDIGHEDGRYFFAMEYLHGHDARALLRRARKSETRIPLEHALTVIAGVAAGLHYAHEKVGPDGQPLMIVHRDVSPSNIFVTYDGGVKLVDFGIARASTRTSETRTGSIKGKLAYMSPEQCKGEEIDRRSDIFSLGVVLYELSTSSRLFRKSSAESDYVVMDRIVKGAVPRPSVLVPGYPVALERVVMRALAIEPGRRYLSAQDLLVDLEMVAAELRVPLSQVALSRYLKSVFGAEPEPWRRGEDSESHPSVHSGQSAQSGRSQASAPSASSSRSARPSGSYRPAQVSGSISSGSSTSQGAGSYSASQASSSYGPSQGSGSYGPSQGSGSYSGSYSARSSGGRSPAPGTVPPPLGSGQISMPPVAPVMPPPKPPGALPMSAPPASSTGLRSPYTSTGNRVLPLPPAPDEPSLVRGSMGARDAVPEPVAAQPTQETVIALPLQPQQPPATLPGIDPSMDFGLPGTDPGLALDELSDEAVRLKPRFRWGWMLLILVLLGLGAAAVGYWQAQERANRAIADEPKTGAATPARAADPPPIIVLPLDEPGVARDADKALEDTGKKPDSDKAAAQPGATGAQDPTPDSEPKAAPEANPEEPESEPAERKASTRKSNRRPRRSTTDNRSTAETNETNDEQRNWDPDSPFLPSSR